MEEDERAFARLELLDELFEFHLHCGGMLALQHHSLLIESLLGALYLCVAVCCSML